MNARTLRRLAPLVGGIAVAVLAVVSATPVPAAPDAYKVVPVEKGATIRGFCRMKPAEDGKLPERWKVKITKDNDKGCGDGERETERWVVGEGGALGNCFVSIEAISAGKDWPEAMRKEERVADIDQKGCRYLPHVQWVRSGTQMAIGNDDRAEHNIHGYRESLAETQFNFSSPPGKRVDESEAAYLERTGKYLVKCDIHPWMSAYVHVVSHPYHDITCELASGDKKPGEFVLTDVPPGDYVIVAWHEGMEESPQMQDGKIATYVYSTDITDKKPLKVEAGKDPEPLEFLFDAPKGGGR